MNEKEILACERCLLRIQQLEDALNKIANSYMNMTPTENIAGRPSPARLVYIATKALSSEAKGT